MVSLTDKNKRILDLVKSGIDRHDIAASLGISLYRVNFICSQLSEFINPDMFNINEVDCWLCPSTN
jgi:FixJ family two-component response regulator